MENVYIRKKGSRHIHIATDDILKSKRMGDDLELLSAEEAQAYLSGDKGNGNRLKEKEAELAVHDDRISKIVSAIDMLDPEKDFTKANTQKPSMPTVIAITEAVGFDVTGAEREEAWILYQKQKETEVVDAV